VRRAVCQLGTQASRPRPAKVVNQTNAPAQRHSHNWPFNALEKSFHRGPRIDSGPQPAGRGNDTEWLRRCAPMCVARPLPDRQWCGPLSKCDRKRDSPGILPSGVGSIDATSMNCDGKVIVPAAREIEGVVKGSELTNEMFCWVMAQFFVISASPSLHPIPSP